MNIFKLFIVDDEPAIRLGLSKIIERFAPLWRVAGTAGNYEEAQEQIIQHKPDLILMDVCLPERNGNELHAWLREYAPSTKVIMISGFTDFNYAQESFRLGAEDYLVKPIDREQLLLKLNECHHDLEQALATRRRTLQDKQHLITYWLNQLIKPEAYETEHCELELKELGVPIHDVYYGQLHLEFHRASSSTIADITTTDHYFFKKLLQELITDNGVVYTSFSGQLLLLFWQKSSEAVQQYGSEMMQQIRQFLDNHTQYVYRLNIGSPFPSLSLLEREAISLNIDHQYPNATPEEAAVKDESPTHAQFIKQIQHYLLNHLNHELSLQGVAETFHISTSHLSRIFKQYTGDTYIDYLSRVRIDIAKQQIVSQMDKKISQIAHDIGYRNEKYFSKIFKEKTGLLPSEYRRQYLMTAHRIDSE